MESEHTSWRLLRTPAARGAWNMAVDEAILESVVAGGTKPTLRLYAWEPACLSLGYGQPYTDADQAALSAQGWNLVRRPTGGRAILHVDELTYSVTAAATHPIMQGGILPSYQVISAALLRGLQLLTVPAEREEKHLSPGGIAASGPVCFEVPSDWEITVGGKKLVGSAQVRRIGGVLQHGTLPLTGDLTRITRALRFSSEEERAEAADRLLGRAATVEHAVGRQLSWDAAAAALVEGFIDALGLSFSQEGLTPEEEARAAELAEQKYGHPDWTYRRPRGRT